MKGVTIKIDKVGEIVKGINALVKRDVLVGIPDTTTERREDEDQGPMTNAALGYIHEFGSPDANIPARPFLIPGIREAQDQVTARLKKAADAALEGEPGKVTAQLNAAGIVASAEVKTRINSGDFEPLSDATLAARARRKVGGGVGVRKGAKLELASRAAGNAPSTEFAKPLIDTGQLRNSVTYVVRGS